jgi:hypothetical protein
MDITSLQHSICAFMHRICSVIHRERVAMYRVCGIKHRTYPLMHCVCAPMHRVRSVGHHACSFRHGVPFVSRSALIDCITLKLICAVCSRQTNYEQNKLILMLCLAFDHVFEVQATTKIIFITKSIKATLKTPLP